MQSFKLLGYNSAPQSSKDFLTTKEGINFIKEEAFFRLGY